jgi:hypothetical protein
MPGFCIELRCLLYCVYGACILAFATTDAGIGNDVLLVTFDDSVGWANIHTDTAFYAL